MKRIVFLVLFCGVALWATSGVAQEIETAKTDPPTILMKAWGAFDAGDYEMTILYCDRCITQFSERARETQKKIQDFPKGTAKEIHAYYALNDVATALYIKAEALRKLERWDEAIAVYYDLVENYYYGQCWDECGWFWKPAVAAHEKLEMLREGVFYDFGDCRSATLVIHAWEALDNEDYDAVDAYTAKCIELYADEAAAMQTDLKEVPVGSEEKIHAYWALNDIATAYFIQGERYFRTGDIVNARTAYQEILDKYAFAQCWDPRGWFWLVADGAREKISLIEHRLAHTAKANM